MKRIFLTSGLVLCMACPAFAAVNDGVANIVSGAASANCESSVLETSTAGSTANFVALWQARSYKVTYHPCSPGAATGQTEYDDSATYDTGYVIPAAAGTTAGTAKSGYTFQGWTTSSTPTYTGNTLDNQFGFSTSTTWNIAQNIDVYAACKPNTYKVEYSCGTGATGTPADDNFTFDAPYQLKNGSTVCTKSGFTFNGWSCTNGLSATSGTWGIADNSVCTAQWQANTINLTWTVDGNTYNTGSPSTSCVYGQAIGTLPSAPTKPGYTFVGWDVSSVTAVP